MHNLSFYVDNCAHTLCMNYITNAFLLVSSSLRSKQLCVLCTVNGKNVNKNIQQRTLSGFITIPSINNVLIESEHRAENPICNLSSYYLLYSQTNSKISLFQESNDMFQVEGKHYTYHIWNMPGETAFFLQPASPLETLYCDKQNNYFPRMVIFLPCSEKVLQKFCSKRNTKRSR